MRTLRLNLFWKFSLAILVMVAVFGSINAYFIWRNVQIALEEESQKRGLYISKHLAEEVVPQLLYEDYVAILRMLESALKADTSLEYAFVLNRNYDIVAHTFSNSVPYALIDRNRPQGSDIQEKLFQPINQPNRILRDIATPLLGGDLGVLRIGLREEDIRVNVQKTVNTFWLMAGLFLVLGIAGAFLFSHIITDPIREMETLVRQLDLITLRERSLPRVSIREKLSGRIKMLFRARDEIDVLADSFNAMIGRLEDAYSDLQTAQQKLFQSEKMAVIGTLASGLAHEINNPLAGIQSCLRRIEKAPENIKQNSKYLSLMAEATERIERVVNGMLEFARKQDYKFQQVDMGEVLEKALLLVGYRLESSRIAVRKDIPRGLPKIWGSANHLEQVLVNLIINAIDSIEENCFADGYCERWLKFSINTHDGNLELSVHDSGKGIPSDKLDRIFDPFYTTKQIGKGTGLGLALSLNIIRAHNGQIDVQSRPGQGATFTISLPVKKDRTLNEQ